MKASLGLTDNDDQKNDSDDSHNDHHLHVGPPLLSLELAGLLLELGRAVLQGVGPVIKLRKLLIPLEHLFDVHAHYSDDFIDLLLRLLETLVLWLASGAVWWRR